MDQLHYNANLCILIMLFIRDRKIPFLFLQKFFFKTTRIQRIEKAMLERNLQPGDWMDR